MKKINLGAILIATHKPSSNKMFDCDFYYQQEEYQKEIEECQPHEIILDASKTFTIVIDYPLDKNFEYNFSTTTEGMTRKEFINLVCKLYKQVYKEKNKYRIYGHDISDLVLCSCEIRNKKIKLGVDS